MNEVNRTDRELVSDIITDAFKNNPSVIAVIKNDNKKNERIRALAEYAFDTAFSRKGVFISSDRTGVAICYRYNAKSETIADYFNQLKLVLKVIGITRVFKILKRDGYVKKQRPASGDFLLFWFFGVMEKGKGRGAALELKNIIFNEANKNQLPIYLETSVPQNKLVYERYGFTVYHSWKETPSCPELWFMKKEYSI